MTHAPWPRLLTDAIVQGRKDAEKGRVAQYIPELALADPTHVAVAVCAVSGESHVAGDVDVVFTLQSVSKVFALAHVLNAHDDERVLFEKVSVEPSGDSFHSIVLLEQESGRPRNPLINAGAIVVSELLPGETADQRISGLRTFLCELANLADDTFALDQRVYLSEQSTGFRNRALANYMRHFGVINEPDQAVDTYFRQCSLGATVQQVAQAGLLLANDGVIPATGKRMLSSRQNQRVLALMATCGLYDECGSFAVNVGLPAKSGVSGAMLAIVPGRYSIACYGPALGPKGNSVAGMTMLQMLSEELGLSVFSAQLSV